MNISFDLDGTLIPLNKEFSTEKLNWFGRLLRVEKIREGSIDLITKLHNDGHTINVYTTSFRSKFKIRKTFKYYGIAINKIVNQAENIKALNGDNINSSKYPPLFNFDVHIDDSRGVGVEGLKHNFKTIIIDSSDKDWSNSIVDAINKIQNKNAQ